MKTKKSKKGYTKASDKEEDPEVIEDEPAAQLEKRQEEVKKKDVLSILVAVHNLLCAPAILGFTIGICVTIYRGITYEDQVSIWVWTILSIVLTTWIVSFLLFSTVMFCISFIRKNRMERFAELSIFLVCLLIIVMYYVIDMVFYLSYCNSNRCDVYDRIRGLINKNYTSV